MTKYICKKCEYSTDKKYAWDRHILTQKHLRESCYICKHCNKKYKFPSGLSRHESTCVGLGKKMENLEKTINAQSLTIKEQTKQINNLIINVDNKPSITNNMQINLFLNNKCSNAMNFQDFIDSLNLSIEDLNFTSENGYAKGITNIFVKNLKDLNPIERPIHCSNKSTLEFYVRDENKWDQDVNNKKLEKGIDTISHKQIKMIKDWEKENPEWNETDKGVENYLRMIKELTVTTKEKYTTDIKKKLGNTWDINSLIEK